MPQRHLLWIILIVSLGICLHARRRALLKGRGEKILNTIREVQSGILTIESGLLILNQLEKTTGGVDVATKTLLEKERAKLLNLEKAKDNEKYWGTIIYVLIGVSIGLGLLFLSFFTKWICTKIEEKRRRSLSQEASNNTTK